MAEEVFEVLEFKHRAEMRFTEGLVACLRYGTALPVEAEVERCVGGFTVRTEEGYFVVTVQKCG